MMKKITRNSLLVLAIVVLLAGFATPAYAVTANVSPIQSRHSKDVAALTNAAEYHGWHADLRGKTGSPSKIVTIATLRNSKWRMTVTVTTTQKNGRIGTTYKINKKAYTLNGIKTTLKKYAISADIRAMLEDEAAIKAEALKKYAIKCGWSVTQGESYKKGKANNKLTFSNSKYKFAAVVSCVRKNGKIVTSYLRENKSSSAKAVKSWLKQYKA